MQAMPQAVQADWNLIREMYTQGLKCAEIEKQTGVKAGTIASRASRCKWTGVALQAKQAVQKLIKGSEGESASKLGDSSERTRSRLARLVERSAERIEEMTLKSPSHALKVNQELESVVRNAKTVFGWTENQQAPAIRIAVLAQVTLTEQGTVQTDPSALTCIDTECVPVTDPKDTQGQVPQ